ncbi:hypothetical protein BBF96_01590 [Anoxybacter fermentans]|uniref:Uncharacterized protein n=1 Tax=Anoxybacter fermentans TaxID=1323375 RepID=A0A3S9SV76_9FIRM|nr:hypothetical protein BBF96_01590 [Anoxybacter fermentans]
MQSILFLSASKESLVTFYLAPIKDGSYFLPIKDDINPGCQRSGVIGSGIEILINICYTKIIWEV